MDLNNLDNNSNANANWNLNNNAQSLRITHIGSKDLMSNLYSELCSYQNLDIAFHKARKGKTLRKDVIEFQNSLKTNLLMLQSELIFQKYKPKPLKTFILRDPKTRKISKSDFRDRVVHHALCNIIEPILSKSFIYDSYANRKGKGVFKAIERFDQFKRKVSKNNTKTCYALKGDIRHYFENVDHKILLSIIQRKIQDNQILKLIGIILSNFSSTSRVEGRNLKTTGSVGGGGATGQPPEPVLCECLPERIGLFCKAQTKGKILHEVCR